MKNKKSIISLLLLGQLLCAASAMAITDQRMLNRYRGEQPKAIQEYINVWLENQPESAFEKPLTKILRLQTMALAYGVDANDDIMVAHLYQEEGQPVSLRVFAARLFFHQLHNETGWRPDMTAPLRDKHYKITPRNINDPMNEDQFNLILP